MDPFRDTMDVTLRPCDMFSLLTDHPSYKTTSISGRECARCALFYDPIMQADSEHKKYRKYGTKTIASIGVRSYYRCTSGRCQCPHRKWITRHNDGTKRISTHNQHTCHHADEDEKKHDLGVVPPLRVDRLKRRSAIALTVVCKRTATILGVSRTYAALVLAQDASFVGKSLSDHLYPLLASNDHDVVIKMVRERSEGPRELRVRTSREWKVCMLHMVQDWHPEFCVMVWQDVTPSKATMANR